MNKYEDLGIDLKNFSKEEEISKFDDATPPAWHILIRLYTETAVTKGGIILTPTMHDDQQYKSCVGLVVKKGKGAYVDPRYESTGSWCEVGDWIAFGRHAGIQMKYRGLPIVILPEDAPRLIVKNPSDITR